jgi:hypothetical protein
MDQRILVFSGGVYFDFASVDVSVNFDVHGGRIDIDDTLFSLTAGE